MSSDEDDIDLNDDSQLDNITEDGMDTETTPSWSEQPQDTSEPPPIVAKRNVNFNVNPAALTCQTYDCVPLAAAIHPNQIHSLATTRCFRWVFTGSEDGYVRKWDFFASLNGKTMLTQMQRHQHVDSVTMAGVISSWWENEEQPPPPPQPAVKVDGVEQPPTPAGEPKLSSVYSMDVHSEALWALVGTESGGINLTTVRHDEGKSHHVLRHHVAPVSVLRITPGETGAISGSWDKSVLEWDLNTGDIVRQFTGHSSQISSAAFQPLFTSHVPVDTPTDKATTESTQEEVPRPWDQKNPNILLTTSVDGQCLIWDRREADKQPRRLGLPDRTPPWCISACWSADGSKIYVGRRNGTVDEWEFASQKYIRSFRMPANSGPVSCVASMPNNQHIICASNDNIRLWNTSLESAFTIHADAEPGFVRPTKSSSMIPFTILPGHHGGCISHIAIDPTCRYMITTSGNRGWEGTPTNACLFYEITPIAQ